MAEQAAAEMLLTRGYTIRERNWCPGRGHLEIDIIAQKEMTLAFVEVKARTSDFIDPVQAVTPAKIKKIVRAANVYMLSLPAHEADALMPRFDIMAVAGTPPLWDIEHIPDAFIPPLSAR